MYVYLYFVEKKKLLKTLNVNKHQQEKKAVTLVFLKSAVNFCVVTVVINMCLLDCCIQKYLAFRNLNALGFPVLADVPTILTVLRQSVKAKYVK